MKHLVGYENWNFFSLFNNYYICVYRAYLHFYDLKGILKKQAKKSYPNVSCFSFLCGLKIKNQKIDMN